MSTDYSQLRDQYDETWNRVSKLEAENAELEAELARLRAETAQLKEQAIIEFRMDELEAVMLSVDKWLDYDEDDRQRPNPATRAAEAREIALQAIEKQRAEVDRLNDHRRELLRQVFMHKAAAMNAENVMRHEMQRAEQAAEPPCESECNPFSARCGAKFCSYDGMHQHEEMHRKLSTPAEPEKEKR